MDIQLYKRVQDIVEGLSAIEEKQNQKLDEVLKQLAEIKKLLTGKTDIKEAPKLKVKK